MIRVFLALDLPSDIKSSLSLLSADIRGAKWVPMENLHLTIRFIGEIYENQLMKIKEELREINFAPFVAKLKDLGQFSGRSGPKVIWAGVDPKNIFLDLRKEVDEALLNAEIGLEKEVFKPHVTLARLKNSKSEELAEYLQDKIGFYTRDFEFKEIKLFSSKLDKNGPKYFLEEIFPFGD